MLSTRIRARAWPGAASQIRTVPSLPPVASHWLSGEICQRPTGHRTPVVAPTAESVKGRGIRVARSAERGARLSSGQQFAGQGVGHGGGAAGHFEFGEDVLDMVLGGAPADVQGLADVRVGGAVGEQPQYLQLA